ncbi:unnamed protein product [Lepeophtheirus salmonis]|uniref:(salmon louse) hypothetical protein n=1 Tax=Lepeophtheirus salmonis TaxID=72036 RepID=A0A7R8CJX8_LEPSM|nr:unnamed protein product [Lepeophtheirus salmonis]CAF2845564.1 unnamed protein product [Lepeophtheirus salmonis]
MRVGHISATSYGMTATSISTCLVDYVPLVYMPSSAADPSWWVVDVLKHSLLLKIRLEAWHQVKVHELTDEDSGYDNSAKHVEPDDLSGNQLRVSAEMKKRGRARDFNVIKVPPRKINEKRSTSKKETPNVTWYSNKKNANTVPIFREADNTRYRNFTPGMLYELFFDEELIIHIVEQITVQ